MASIETLLEGDILRFNKGFGMSVVRRHEDSIESLPVTFDNPADYYAWLDRNAERVCGMFSDLPNDVEKFREVIRLMAQA